MSKVIGHAVTVDGIEYCAANEIATFTILGFGERRTEGQALVRFIEVDTMPADDHGRWSLKVGDRIRISKL